MADRAPVLVKLYAGSRLYDTARACYVTRGDLRIWAAQGVALVVIEAASGADVTALVMA